MSTHESPQEPYCLSADQFVDFPDELGDAKKQAIIKSYKLTDTPPQEVIDLIKTDIDFALSHPDLPLENVASRWDNYDPKNESQRNLMEMMLRLADVPDYQLAGLFIHGRPGVGKTHLSVAYAKRLMCQGLDTVYINFASQFGQKAADQFAYDPEAIRRYHAVIIDDWNSAYGVEAHWIKKILTEMHNTGGRLLMTSNQLDAESFLSNTFIDSSVDGIRLLDRMKGSLFIQGVDGISQRQTNNWWEQGQLTTPSSDSGTVGKTALRLLP